MLVVGFSSILGGIFFPEISAYCQPYPIYCMMGLIFFSFLTISQRAIFHMVKTSLTSICYYLTIKLILFPAVVFIVFHYACPDYALAALLMVGASSAVASPFFGSLVKADMPLIFGMLVTSSILVPFTLPALVKLLAARNMEISLLAMVRMLCLVVFIPIFIAEALKRFSPGSARKLSEWQYPVSLLFFSVTNLGIFSKYAGFLRAEPFTVAVALAVSIVLAGVSFVVGILTTFKKPLADQLSIAIGFGLANNVLILVFSSQFFGHREPMVAAMYTVPFFALIIPLRLYRNWRTAREDR